MEHTQPVGFVATTGRRRDLGGGDRLPAELDGSIVGPGQDRAFGGSLQDGDPVQPRVVQGDVVVPEFKCPFEVTSRLGEGIDAFGRRTGGDEGRQRASPITCRHPVVGKFGRRDGYPADFPTSLEFLAEGGMEPVTFTVEQLARRDLREEGVPKGVAAQRVVEAIGVDEDPLGDRRSQRIRDRPRRHLEHGCEQLVVDAASGGRCRPEDPLGVGRKGGQAGNEDVAEARGEGPAGDASAGSRRQLLHEERIAATPLHHVVDRGRRRCDPSEVPHHDEDVMPAEPAEIEPNDPCIPLELGHERQDRIAPLQLIRPERGEQHDRRIAQVAREESEQPAGPVVGPLDVLHHEHDWPVASLAFDHAQHGLEEPRLSLAIEL